MLCQDSSVKIGAYTYELSIGQSIGINSQSITEPHRTIFNTQINFFNPENSIYTYKFGISNTRTKVNAGLYFHAQSITYKGLELEYFPFFKFKEKKFLNVNFFGSYGLELGRRVTNLTVHRFGLGSSLDLKIYKKLYFKTHLSFNVYSKRLMPTAIGQFLITYRF